MLSFCSSSAILLKEKLTFPDKILLIYCGDTPKRSASPFLFKPLDSIYSTKDKAMLENTVKDLPFLVVLSSIRLPKVPLNSIVPLMPSLLPALNVLIPVADRLQTVKAGQKSIIKMKEDSKTLEEVVVVGYGVMKNIVGTFGGDILCRYLIGLCY